MNEQHAKGAADKVAGKIKEFAGRVTGNKKLETEGKVDQVKGAIKRLAARERAFVTDGRTCRPREGVSPSSLRALQIVGCSPTDLVFKI
jgi:uncharacterized protein YjbJ (UPF0337 family)